MNKKVVGILVLVVLMMAMAGLGIWAGVAADNSSQNQDEIPWLGVNLSNINSRLADRLGLSQDEGVVIIRVVSDSPAEQAGLQAKDILLKVDDTDIDTVKDAKTALSAYEIGDVVTLTILRETETLTFNVTLAAIPEINPPKALTLVQGWPALVLYGLNWSELLEELNLEDIERDQLFDHYLGAQIKLTDKDGNLVTVQTIPGVITSVSETAIELEKNEGGTVSLTVPDDAVIRKGNRAVELSDLEVGDKAVVVTINDEVKAIMVAQEVTIWPGMRGNGLKIGQLPNLDIPQIKGGVGNMLNNMAENWQKHLERFQEKLQENQPASIQ